MELREQKRPRMEKRSDVEIISNRTLLVFHLTCVRHPYLFPLLRQVCKANRDDDELEIEFLKYSKGYKRSRDGLKYLLGRLDLYVDSMSTETLMEYMIELISSDSENDPYTESSEMKSLLIKMKGSEKHKDAIEGRARCHYNSLKKCTEALMWACWAGLLDIVRMLLPDPRIDASAMNQQAIRYACIDGHIEIIRMLLADPRVDPSANHQYAIRWASRNGHTEIVRVLLAHPRVDPSAENQYAIQMASKNGHIEIVRMLLADPRVTVPE
jgi:putative ubiquitin-RnfH superfamily antitoxin RatB of RatAB toxin-antitoxin module